MIITVTNELVGELQPGVTLRDIVNAIPYVAMQEGKLTVEKQNKKNVFNGRIMEMEGLPGCLRPSDRKSPQFLVGPH